MLSPWIRYLLSLASLGILLASFFFPHVKIDTNTQVMLLFAFLPWLPDLVKKLKIGKLADIETVQSKAPEPRSSAPQPTATPAPSTARPLDYIRPPDLADTYLTRMVKLVPIEMIALFLILDSQVATAEITIPGWPALKMSALLFIGCLVLTFVYVYVRTSYPRRLTTLTHAMISSLGFVAWIFCIGGPFKDFAWYQPVQGYIALLLS